MTSYAQYPHAALQAVGTNLTSISEQVQSKSKGANDVMGLTSDQDRINGAIGDFRSEWEASVKKLGENIGSFGELSGQIGAIAANTDQQLATAMRPGGGASSSTPPGGHGRSAV